MGKFDGRKLSHATLEDIRILAVQRVRQGESPEVVIAALGFSRMCIYRWLAAHRSGGIAALKSKELSGRPKKLSASQIAWIYKAVTGGNPDQYQLEFSLWTLKLILQLIYDKFKIKLSKSSLCRLLNQLGLTPQKPIFKSYQQKRAAVKEWLQERYPQIKKMAAKVGAKIFFCDESGIRTDFHAGTTWGKKGRTPIIKDSGTRFSVNMISAVSAQGELRFMVVDKTVTGETFRDFLKRLIAVESKPVFVIVDGGTIHRAKVVSEYVKSTAGMLELFFLPPYSPELNPDEYVWNDLKNNKLGRKISTSKAEMKANAIGGLRSIQKSKKKVKSYFQAKHTKYAA